MTRDHRSPPRLPFPGRLRDQVGVLFLIALLMPLLFGLLGVWYQLENARRQASDDAGDYAHAAAAEIEQLVELVDFTGQTIDQLPAFWDGSDDDRDRLLAALVAGRPYVNAAAFIMSDLRQHGLSNQVPGEPRAAVGDRPYIREVIATGRLTLTEEPVISRGSGAVILPITTPVRDRARPERQGYLIIGLKVDEFPAIWRGRSLPGGTVIRLVDLRAGRILADSQAGPLLQPQQLDPYSLEQLQAGRSTFELRSADEPPCLRIWEPVGDSTWAVLVDLPIATIEGPIREQVLRSALPSLLLAGLVGVLLILCWRRLHRRFEALHDAAGRWAQGDHSHRIGVPGRDELSTLARAFDQMADQLAAAAEATEQVQRRLSDQNLELERLNRALDLSLCRRQVLLRAARTLSVESDPDRLLSAVLREAIAMLGGDGGRVSRWDPAAAELVTVDRCAAPLDATHPDATAPGAPERASRRALDARTSVILSHPLSGLEPCVSAAGACNVVAAPLVHEERPLGALCVSCSRLGAVFTIADAEALELLAGFASAALIGLERSRLEGAVLTARETAHLLNNDLALVMGALELVRGRSELSPHQAALLESAWQGLEAAARHVSQLQRVIRFETRETAAGPSLDLERSAPLHAEGLIGLTRT